MKILIDLTECIDLNLGTSIYCIRFIKGLPIDLQANLILLVPYSTSNKFISMFPNIEHMVFNKRKTFFGKLGDIFQWYKIVNSVNCDVVFLPTLNFLYVWKTNKPIVQTIHDLQPLKVFPPIKKCVYKLLMPMVLKRSKRIIAISDFVLNEIVEHYKFTTNKVRRVYNSVEVISEPKCNLPEKRYILTVNALRNYKNILTLLKAYKNIQDQIDQNLIIIGRKSEYWDSVLFPFIVENNLTSRVKRLENLSEDELAAYYKNADLFITTSLLEGFGYTPIEAALYSVPVISTKESALYETTLGLLNYYNPATDENELSKKIIDVLSSPCVDKVKYARDIFQQMYNMNVISNQLYQKIIEVTVPQ